MKKKIARTFSLAFAQMAFRCSKTFGSSLKKLASVQLNFKVNVRTLRIRQNTSIRLRKMTSVEKDQDNNYVTCPDILW